MILILFETISCGDGVGREFSSLSIHIICNICNLNGPNIKITIAESTMMRGTEHRQNQELLSKKYSRKGWVPQFS